MKVTPPTAAEQEHQGAPAHLRAADTDRPKKAHKQQTLMQLLNRIAEHQSTQPAPRDTNKPECTDPEQHETADAQAPRTANIMLWNVRGIQTAAADCTDLNSQYKPDILVLTETKLRTGVDKRRQHVHNIFKDYRVQHGTLPPDHPGAGEGVTIAIHNDIAERADTAAPTVPQELAGQLAHFTVRPTHGNPWHVVGAYPPPTHCPAEREPLYKYITEQILNPARFRNETVLLAGDWNATLHDTDRSTHNSYPTDELHRQFVGENKLVGMDTGDANRQHTWTRD